ncbi:N-acetyltransferase ESCO1 [Bombina bombina]|uniref:N-acetyltransferase ESCO1 n=1 Tax=Bombina bombina TaxID=8345 RepID=UPI00235AFC3C|nr:N-acetyltransferase ESCO1 [Bombina bombina]
MASKKRKATLPGSPAKKQKLEKDSSRIAIKKRNSVSKASQYSVKNKNAPKVSGKPKISVKKAVKTHSQSCKNKDVQKRKKNEPMKISSVRNVPAKKTVLKISKEVANSKKNSRKSTQTNSKASKKAQASVNRPVSKGATVKNGKAFSKRTKSPCKIPSSSRPTTGVSMKKPKSNAVTRKSGGIPVLKSGKSIRKVPPRGSKLDNGSGKKKLKENNSSLVRESAKKKQKEPEIRLYLDDKSKKVVRNTRSVTQGAGKKSQISKLTVVDPTGNCKLKVNKLPTCKANKINSHHKASMKPSPLSDAPQFSKKGRYRKKNKGEESLVTMAKILRTRTKVQKKEAAQKNKQNDVAKDKAGGTPTLSINPEKRVDTTVATLRQSKSSNHLEDSNATLIKQISAHAKTPNPKASANTSKKHKVPRSELLDKKTKNKLKQKTVLSNANKNKPVAPPEDDPKTKRISILDLCNEIAGEIESDTVEVIKTLASSSHNQKEDNVLGNNESTPLETLTSSQTEESTLNPFRSFFPSRKSLPNNCKLDQKISKAVKNSKWSKIKLKKGNSFGQIQLPRIHTELPNLDSFKAKSKVVQIEQSSSSTMQSLKSVNNVPDLLLPMNIRECKPREREKPITLLDAGQGKRCEKRAAENGLLENHLKHELVAAFDEGFRLHLDSSPENSPSKNNSLIPLEPKHPKLEADDKESQGSDSKQLVRNLFTDQMAVSSEKGNTVANHLPAAKSKPADATFNKEIKKLKDAERDGDKQLIIDAGQKRFGAVSCNICGMLYTVSNPEDETQHLLFHNQFTSAVKYVGWKKERIVAEYPDGKVIMVLPDDPKYALRKVEEIREMVDNDLGFQQVPLKLHSRTKTFLFITDDKKVSGCLIAEHIHWGYRVIDDIIPDGRSEKDKAISERVKAWCCSTSPEPALCGISRIWVFSMMRRKKIASRMLECLRNHFIYGSCLDKGEIAFSDPTPDGKLFATHYFGTSQFLIYNFVSGHELKH